MKNTIKYSALFLLLILFFLYGATFYSAGVDELSDTSLSPPSLTHLLGTDDLGNDIYAQISIGFFRSMFIGIVTAVAATLIGGFLGIISAYKGGTLEKLVKFLINVFLSVPQLPIMIVIGAFWGQSTWNVIFIIACFSWANIAKQLYAKVLSIKNKEYVKLAKSYGGNMFYVIYKHLSREIIPLLITNGFSVIGRSIVQESSLAYLGLSDPVAKSWGLMIAKATAFQGIYFSDYWKWWLVAPIFSLILSVVSLRLISRTLEFNWLRGE
ncbi:MAG: ABC transporter permease [Clostridiaceae bacterium]|nr:ABC transporter permease [Clostridiaceae bacterium]